jgi:hypothetical protein
LDTLGLSDVKVLTRMADLGRLLVSHNKRDMVLRHEAWLTWRSRWHASTHPLSDHAGILLVPHAPVPHLIQIIDAYAGLGNVSSSRILSWTASDGWYEIFP